MPDFDLAVLGGNPAGLSVAAGAAQLGLRVALIASEPLGDPAPVTRCALLAASRAMRESTRAAALGVIATPVLDWDRMRAHVRGTLQRLAPQSSAARMRALGATVIQAQPRFVGPHSVTAAGQRIAARWFVIAAATRPLMPAAGCWTEDTILDLPAPPEHLLVLGGGPAALELADAFAGFGCQVTLVSARRIADTEDLELADGLRLALRRRGVTFREDVDIQEIGPGPALLRRDGSRIVGSHLLAALGRVPDVACLDLAAAGIAAGPDGVLVDTALRSATNRRVFAVGDAASPPGSAARDAAVVLRQALFRLPARVDGALVPRVTMTDPELASVGMTEAAPGCQVLRWPLADNDRAVAERQTGGLVKLVTRRGRVVGAGILAPRASEMIGQCALAVARRLPVAALAGIAPPYPARAEALQRAAGSSQTERLTSEPMRRLIRALRWLP